MYSVTQFIKELPLLALVAIFCMLFVGFKRVRDFSISTEGGANKDSKKIRKEFYELISQIVAECKKNRIYVKVLPLKILNSKDDLGFSSAPSWVHVVVYTPVVIKHYSKDPRIWEIAIVQSIGHELGHRQDIYRDRFHKKQPEENQNFFYWTREIRCDFYGVDFAQSFREGYSRDEIITAVAKKADVYMEAIQEYADSKLRVLTIDEVVIMHSELSAARKELWKRRCCYYSGQLPAYHCRRLCTYQ